MDTWTDLPSHPAVQDIQLWIWTAVHLLHSRSAQPFCCSAIQLFRHSAGSDLFIQLSELDHLGRSAQIFSSLSGQICSSHSAVQLFICSFRSAQIFSCSSYSAMDLDRSAQICSADLDVHLDRSAEICSAILLFRIGQIWVKSEQV